MKYDFSGWATRNNLKCADGRTIMAGAFKDNDGQTVPLVWNHDHNSPDNILGHALLENRDNGVYAYCSLNDTQAGNEARELIKHGDINALSIYANQLQQKGGNVIHGAIREVSLVLAGANPGAYIDSIMIHGAESDDEAVIYTDETLELSHADDDMKGEDNMADEGKTVGDVFETLNDEQKTVVYAMIAQALKDGQNGAAGEDEPEEGEDDETMKHNLFDQEDTTQDDVLIHDGLNTIIQDGKRFGSMKESFLQHADEYGIENIDYLFPEATELNNPPEFIKRQPSDWVGVVMSGVHKTPFSRIKTTFADITADEARAKGYIKGNRKKDEVFTLLKRKTEPTTIYKKQKMDRDDVIDITDFDVIAWIKTEMRLMLDEEIARAALFGDGRLSSSDEKINEANIRPVVSDDDLYAIKVTVTPGANETLAHAFVTSSIKAQDDYQGSGNITAFIKASVVTEMLLMEDKNGHRLYNGLSDLANALNVSRIVKIPATVMPESVLGVALDLKDYAVGADKGGAINMFDDFDIDYNQQKYLIETRCSGALTKPYSAMVFKEAKANAKATE